MNHIKPIQDGRRLFVTTYDLQVFVFEGNFVKHQNRPLKAKGSNTVARVDSVYKFDNIVQIEGFLSSILINYTIVKIMEV